MVPLAFLFVYFCVGFASSFPSTSVTYVLLESKGYTASKLATVSIFTAIPWTLKSLFASVSDTVPLFGYRRRPYIFLGSIIAAATFALTPYVSDNYGDSNLILCLGVSSFAVCLIDVAADSLQVEFVRREAVKGSTQSQTWFWRVAGTTLGISFGGLLYARAGQDSDAFTIVMRVTALAPLALGLVCWDIPEERVQEGCRSPHRSCFEAVKNFPSIVHILIPAGIVALVPETDSALLYYYESDAKIGPAHLSIIIMSGCVASMVTLGAYNLMSGVSHRKAFALGIVLSALAEFLGWLTADDKIPMVLEAACVQSALKAMARSLLMMPIIVLVALRAPKGAQGTSYSLALSILNLMSVGSESITAATLGMLKVRSKHTDNVRVFLFCVMMVTLVTLPLSGLLPARGDGAEISDAQQQTRCKTATSDFTLEYSDSESEIDSNEDYTLDEYDVDAMI